MTRIPLIAVVLVVVNVALAALLGTQLLQGSRRDSLLNTEPRKIAAVQLQLDTPNLAANLESIQAGAVFHSSRNFYVAPPPSTIVQPPPDYRLAGSMSVPNKPLAAMLVHNQSNARTRVVVGDQLEGWMVVTVEARRVVLQRDDRTVEIGAGSGTRPGGMNMVRNDSAAAATAPATGSGMVRVLSGEGRANSKNASPPSDTPRSYRPPDG